MRRALLALTLLPALAHAQVEVDQCEEPNVMLVLDRSGSMLEDRKWQQAVEAVTALTRTFEFRIRFGLMVFPWSGECSVPGDALRVNVAPLNGPPIQEELGRVGPERRNNTPIDRAVSRARDVFVDLRDQGRRSFIVLITDGKETCDGDPTDAAQRAALSGFPLFVIGFGGGVDRRVLDRMAELGGTGQAYQANDGRQLFQALEAIADAAGEELCDAKDNDCDGMVDEDVPEETCATECGTGRRICVDGQLSECFGGDIPDEACDGADNDCDGRVDEVQRVPCVTVGGNPGTTECVDGAPRAECDPDDPSAEEICDGADNDADGLVDENTDEVCAIECHSGRRICVEGSLIRCTAAPVGEEVCDGADDDCDGQIDEMAECVGQEICGHEGQCLQPCPFNECPEHFVCAPDGYCHPKLCDPFCAPEQRCVNERCLDVCVVDQECAEGLRCEGGLCRGDARPVGPGEPERDAGRDVPPVIDAPDAGPAPEADVDDAESGCACDVRGGGGAWWLLLLLPAVRRRGSAGLVGR